MLHKKFEFSVSPEMVIDVKFDLDYNGGAINIGNIELWNKVQKIGDIKYLEGFANIHSYNPDVFNEDVKNEIMLGIIKIANEGLPMINN